MISSDSCLGPSPRTQIPFFLLSICSDKLFYTSKITTFLPQSKPGYERSEREPNPVPYSE